MESARSRDKEFIEKLKFYIDSELEYFPPNGISKERFIIFQQAFNQIFDYVQSYRSLLGNIKKEYELCISALEKGHMEAINLKNDLNKAVGYSTTIVNLKRRNDELKNRASQLFESNKIIENELENIMKENSKYRPKTDMFKGKYPYLASEELGKDEEESDEIVIEELIPNLSIEETTSVNHLFELNQKLDYKLRDLTSNQAIKYTPKARKFDLLAVLADKVTSRDNMQIKTDALKHKLHLFKLAVNAAKDYYNGDNMKHQQHNSIQEALVKAILNGSLGKQIRNEEDNDPIDEGSTENEAEFILDYIDKFNELFETGKYKEAAYFAAASPRNVLRTIETLYRFKTVSNIKLGDKDPMFLYCNAILDSISETIPKPDAIMSLEFVKIVLTHDKIDVLTRWISQRKITFTYDIAKTIEDFVETRAKYTRKGLELSLFIYNDIKCVLEATICMIKLGRIKAALQFVKVNSAKLKPDAEFYLRLLQKCPELEFANALCEESVPVEQIVQVLLDSEQAHNGLKFIKIQIDNMSKDFIDSLDELRQEEYKAKKQKLKASYETLMKFSFLTQDDDEFTKSLAVESRDHVQQLYSRLGNDQTLNSLASMSFTKKPKTPKTFDKSVKFEKIEKDTMSSQNMTRSESISYFEQTNSISGETASTEPMEESSKLKNSVSVSTGTVHNDFYNKFNEEIFDDEDLN